MGLRVQFKRGASKYIMNHAFDDGEIVINTDTKSLHVGDGETLGGHEIPSKVEVEKIVKNSVSISKDPEDLENGSFTVSQSSNVITEDPDVSILALQNDIWGYKNTVDYAVGTYVMYQNNIYKCIQANGASSTVVAPDSVSPLGSNYWKNIENQSSGHALFDVVPKDHVLTYGKDLEGFAPLGTWVYKDAVDGSRYGYPDFVQKCLDEYAEATADTITADSVTLNIKRHSNGHVFFDVADIETVNTYFNTYGHAWFYGIDETNERIFLPRQAHGKLIESWKDGTSWYRIYEDGWCEQGGYSVNNTTIISIHKPFIDTNYNVQIRLNYLNSGTIGGNYWAISQKNTSSFVVGQQEIALPVQWQASGYINLDTIEVTPSYEYMVVGNVKVEQASTDVIDATTTNNDTVPLFAPHYFDYTPNNLSWLKGGEQSNSGDLYKTCYNELVNILNGETKYGSLKVIDESDMVQGEDYSLYWIVNQTTETFRTPTKTQQRFVVKTYQNGYEWYRIYNDGWCEQGSYCNQTDQEATIALMKSYVNTNYNILIGKSSRDTGAVGIQANILSSSSFLLQGAYNGSSQTLRPSWWQASGYIDLTNEQIDTSLYFKVANAVENIQMLDVGEVTNALNLRADLSLANVNNNGKIAIAHNAMPSDVCDDLTLGVSGSIYTAPADGFFYFAKQGSINQSIYLVNLSSGMATRSWSSVTSGANGLAVWIPCKKGEQVRVGYEATGITEVFRFIYAVGSESEQ